ncbi:AcrR family transcriptional regulator [Agromyces terreus]|uniref:AcrR family transcriptional regulator n=1 Tax=Agromyces terreus TaxID=424795 RepID=A0A9X2H0P8_9MICO|nr:TetR family transcriptional regulator C-terminal domain-containing protein [Agromyces terreus]MCP2370813.1 AcrR family transcriptional regulator [Agromyces terreus]
MSRPVRKKAERKSPAERAAEIAAAAREVAVEDGISALTLRSIAARIDVAPALVAHYEPNMESLIARTFGGIVQAELIEVGALVADLATPRARLSHLLDTLLDGTRDDVTLIWVEAWAMGRRNEALAQRVRDEMDDWHAFLLGIVTAGVAEGEFETDDPAGVAWQLLGMIDGLNAHALVRWGDSGERGSRIGHAVEGMLGMRRGALAVG